MSEKIRAGQKLQTLKGDFVTVKSISADRMVVTYGSKDYVRDPAVIGVTLFIIPEKPTKIDTQPEFAQTQDRICINCMEYRIEECIGKKAICEFFRYAPSHVDTSHWPTEADASKYRRLYGKK